MIKFYIINTIVWFILANPVDVIVNRQYQGQYLSTQIGNNFDYLQGKSGQIMVVFYGSPNRDAVNSAQFFLLDPKYQDEKSILLVFQGIIDVNQTGVWQSIHSARFAKVWRQREGDIIQEDAVSTTITFNNLDSQNFEAVTISIQSKGSTFQFSANLTYYDRLLSTMEYSLYVSGVVAIQIFSAFKLLKIMQVPNFVFCAKISLLTLSLCNIYDFSQTMTHVQYIMGSSSGYLFYIIPSFAYIVLFIIFDMKMLFLVWKSHHIIYMDDPQMLRKKLTSFYIKFYLGLFIFLGLNYFFYLEVWMIVLTYIAILPQVIHNVRMGQKPHFNPFYIFGYIGSRFLILFYERTCPQNRFKLSPNIPLCLALGSAYILIVILIGLQKRLGSRFFVPKRFLPSQFQYKRKIKLDEQNKEQDCAICLQNLFLNALLSEQSQNREYSYQSANQKGLLEQTSIMVTPCNHKFHVECLTQWLDVKLQCPTCRAPLPPVDDIY